VFAKKGKSIADVIGSVLVETSADGRNTRQASMPIHDWTSVEAGIFHAFHHDWITEISRALNRGLLPAEYEASYQLAWESMPQYWRKVLGD
jgi:hypothetical protein